MCSFSFFRIEHKATVFFAVVTALLFTSCNSKQFVIRVNNPSGFDRTAQTIEIPLHDVKLKLGKFDFHKLEVINEQYVLIPYQITYDGKLLFQIDIQAEDSRFIRLKRKTNIRFKSKTYARFIEERKDDFAWENDKVAFRIYGPALKPVDGPSNGIDCWYKRTSTLIIDKWYENDLSGKASYHEDHGEGLDDYKVGRSLGAGGMAPFMNDSLWLNENFVSQEVLDNGPIRSTFKLVYNDLDVNGKKYAETRTISIDAGSQLTKITQSYEDVSGTITVAAGLVKREGSDSVVAKDNYVIYAEPYSDKVENVFLALLFPNGYKTTTVNTYKVGNTSYSHVMAVCDCNGTVTYYAGYGWSKAGVFTDIAAFEKYISKFSQSLKVPLEVIYLD